ncbi:MAG: hypothetical protein HN795_02775 [Flavobacteriaceae bacterium]|nr:hypothetical protein [Flavobacteriaceae bacterium]
MSRKSISIVWAPCAKESQSNSTAMDTYSFRSVLCLMDVKTESVYELDAF